MPLLWPIMNWIQLYHFDSFITFTNLPNRNNVCACHGRSRLVIQGELEHFEEAHEEDRYWLLKLVNQINYALKIDRKLLHTLVNETIGKVWITMRSTLVKAALLTEFVVEDGHAAVWQVLQGFEEWLESLCQALRGCRIDNLLER